MSSTQIFNLWFLYRRVPDGWEVHCLELDLVTYGDTLEHASEMGREAVSMILVDDLVNGHNPLDRQAPDEIYEEMLGVVHGGERVDTGDPRLEREAALVVQHHRVRVTLFDHTPQIEDEPGKQSFLKAA